MLLVFIRRDSKLQNYHHYLVKKRCLWSCFLQYMKKNKTLKYTEKATIMKRSPPNGLETKKWLHKTTTPRNIKWLHKTTTHWNIKWLHKTTTHWNRQWVHKTTPQNVEWVHKTTTPRNIKWQHKTTLYRNVTWLHKRITPWNIKRLNISTIHWNMKDYTNQSDYTKQQQTET